MPNLSVNCCAGAFCCCASLMSVMILWSELGGGPRDRHLDRAPQIDGSGQRGVADVFGNRCCFASEIRFVAARPAFRDFRDGKLRAGFDEQPHSGLELFHLHLAFAALFIQRGGGLGASRKSERISFCVRPRA